MHLGVVHLAVVQVQVQGAVVGEQPPGLDEPRLQEGPVVAERVVVLVQRALDGVVGAALEADPVASPPALSTILVSWRFWTRPVLKGGST